MLNKSFWSDKKFLVAVLIIGVSTCIHVIFIFLDIGVPIALLTGPVLFVAQLTLRQRRSKQYLGLHIAPFFVFSVWYSMVLYDGWGWKGTSTQYYFYYFACTILSLITYSALVSRSERKWQMPVSRLKVDLIHQLSIINVIVAVLIILLLIDMRYVLSFDVAPQSIMYLLLLFAIALIIAYVYRTLSLESRFDTETDLVARSPKRTLPETLLKEYEKRLYHCLLEKKLYLRCDFSADLLAQETEIPKHHLFVLFNIHLGKSFYQLIAEYRINYAIALMHENNNVLTIESLAYECGFNSKTSFNKYFRELTGLSPSEFRERQSISL